MKSFNYNKYQFSFNVYNLFNYIVKESSNMA